MILDLEPNGALRMSGAHGMRVEVLDGHLWITHTGRTEDVILGRGARYRVESDDVVLVGLDKAACVELGTPGRDPLWRRLWRAWRQAAEARAAARDLQALSDHRLRDLGISRDQIRTMV